DQLAAALGLPLVDPQAVTPGGHPPVDVSGAVATDELPYVHELDAVAALTREVGPGDRSERVGRQRPANRLLDRVDADGRGGEDAPPDTGPERIGDVEHHARRSGCTPAIGSNLPGVVLRTRLETKLGGEAAHRHHALRRDQPRPNPPPAARD